MAVYVDAGAGSSQKNLMRILESYPSVQVTPVKAVEIAAGKLKDFDVVIQPGGSGGKQGRTLGEPGREAIRKFVRDGGGYLGFCAGAYLASNDYSWSLNLLDAKVLDRKHWARGYGKVQLGITPAGKRILGVTSDVVTIYYHQGPLFAPNGNPKIDDYELLAKFETEVKTKGVPGGVMKGTAAIIAGRFGKGRVFCFSPHPEKTKELESLVKRAVEWTAKRNPQPKSVNENN